MTIGVLVLPAYEEGSRLGAVLEGIDACGLDLEVVVVDDGSRDDTSEVARRGGATVVRHPFNLGYGASLQTGYKYALRRDATLLVQMDADGQHDPADIRGILEPLLDGSCDLVIGSRFHESSGYRMGPAREAARSLLSGIAKLAGLHVTDPTSGFQAMNRGMLDLYAGDAFPADYPDLDVLIAAHRGGWRVTERPVRMSAAVRPSTLHGGARSFYYAYRMLLSLVGIMLSRGGRRAEARRT